MPRASYVFLGRFEPASFAEFVRHRAARLAIAAEIGALGAERIEVAVAGAEELIEMFEMACSLGPIDCVVLDVLRRPN
ncbi:hypothetical protein [Prosthecomicrobium pneumaticum]|uniref:Acylphosphatase n=1 Tax=Prosthecomicrobium pneumaticum TaxID=81895 RepID=A0A7W9FQ36_9HYPH|nr:hypothetical protein [Prosthecomicrobium pneumaticum]MBB5754797.1 acylphosphatase [Prosthecomicrobium pneumaticum]